MACSVMMPRLVGRGLLRRQVERLATGHAAQSRGARQPAHKVEPPLQRLGRLARRDRRYVGDNVERQRQQAVAGEDRRRLVEGAVHRRLAAAQIVVVHRRQVVMDQ